jgi:hypothetical protein
LSDFRFYFDKDRGVPLSGTEALTGTAIGRASAAQQTMNIRTSLNCPGSAPGWTRDALSVSLHEHSTVTAVRIFQLVSVFGDASTLFFISFIFVVALLVTRYWRLVYLWTITLPGAGILNQFLKNTLQRQRPQLPNPWIAESGWSFPQRSRNVFSDGGNLLVEPFQ